VKIRGSPRYCKNDEPCKIPLKKFGKGQGKDEFKPGNLPLCKLCIFGGKVVQPYWKAIVSLSFIL